MNCIIYNFPILFAYHKISINQNLRNMRLHFCIKEKASHECETQAPQVGLEPTTLRLTAECSAIELLRNM